MTVHMFRARGWEWMTSFSALELVTADSTIVWDLRAGYRCDNIRLQLDKMKGF